MRESTRAWLLVAVLIAGVLVTYFFFFRPFMQQQPLVQAVINANSTWSIAMQEYELRGPLSGETYRITNDNGKTTLFYAATNRAGTVTKEFSVPQPGPQGTFLFEALRADGIWDVDDLPVRPHPVEEYIVEVDQTLGDEGGTRAFGFSDPQYWATTTAQEFQLKLSPTGGQSNSGTSAVGSGGRKLRDPRYLQIVDAIKAFGSSSVMTARAKIREELAATAEHPIQPR